MARSVTRQAVTNGALADLFVSDKAGGADGAPVYGIIFECPLKDDAGADVAGAVSIEITPLMNSSAGVAQEHVLYPGESWTPTTAERNTPITRVRVRKAGAGDSAVTMRPFVF